MTSKITLYSKFLIDDTFILTITPVASFISGQQVSRDPVSPLTNSLYLKEANLSIPLSKSQIVIGALEQKKHLPGAIEYTKSFAEILSTTPIFKTNKKAPNSFNTATQKRDYELTKLQAIISAGKLNTEIAPLLCDY